MKNTIFLIVFAMWFGACASNQNSPSADEKTADTGMPAGKKKVCTHERNTGGISRMKRVCRYEDVDAI